MFLPQHTENRKELNSKMAQEKKTTASMKQQQNTRAAKNETFNAPKEPWM